MKELSEFRRLAAILLVLVPAVCLAQDTGDLKGKSYARSNDFSLFDPSRLTMRQSYTFGYYSGGGSNGSIGYYLNSIEYAFSNPLRIRVDLGYLHNPASVFSRGAGGANAGVFVPGFAVDWSPSRNFNLRLDYRYIPLNSLRGSSYYYNPYYREDYR